MERGEGRGGFGGGSTGVRSNIRGPGTTGVEECRKDLEGAKEERERKIEGKALHPHRENMLDSFKKNLIFFALVTASLVASYFVWLRSGYSLTDNFTGFYSFKENVVEHQDIPWRTKGITPPTLNPTSQTQEKFTVESPPSSGKLEIERQSRNQVDEAFEKVQENSHLWFEEATSQNDRIKTLGTLHNSSSPLVKYAVFSTTTSNREALGFAFYLPLTVIAWQRVGFRSIVLITGTINQWYADEVLHQILESVLELRAFVIFLEPRDERSVMISQVSRLFVANILHTLHPDLPEYYLITSDTDLWPIARELYDPPLNQSIISLNSECCGEFTHHNDKYKMLPIAHIGMNASTWRVITTRFSFSPSTVEEIITFLLREFGSVANQQVVKGENLGWYLDQRSISVLIGEWVKLHAGEVRYVRRNIGEDRIDRSNWNPRSLEGTIDAHLLDEAYVPGNWVRIRDLLLLMYGEYSEQLKWCDDYYEKFTEVFLDQFHKPR
ncbi:hypothetical protein CAPTEDRAFT_201133 [Capitella teleta]|uniref:Uncharacterized protein n=1 Tax=Capitella teleta TaxID=283909 RepID=R7VJ29_CAPTE|nr:hypothetical protein CAPTEDRAFT_201133 [Capitella teleta]|eukprot:ELU15715.1 hypothetical protein CAPTEDRAFT_201133 [Capitella teleta]